MGGCCCCCSYRSVRPTTPIYYYYPRAWGEQQPLSGGRHNHPRAVIVYTNLDTSADVAYPPPPTIDADSQPSPLTVSLPENATTDTPETSPKIQNQKENIETTKDKGFFTPSRQFEEEEDICPTCLEEYDKENPKIITKCDHRFHLSCILEWYERSHTCPICDKAMVFDPILDE